METEIQINTHKYIDFFYGSDFLKNYFHKKK